MNVDVPPIVAEFHERLTAAERELLASDETFLATWRRWYRPGLWWSARALAALDGASDMDAVVERGHTARFAARIVEAARACGAVDDAFVWNLPPRRVASPVDVTPPSLRADFGQLTCDAASRERVARVVVDDFPWGGSILLLGDDDLVGPGLAASGLPTVTVDVDERLNGPSTEHGVRFVHGDVRRLPRELAGRFSAVAADPADGSLAVLSWLSAASATLSAEPGSRFYLSVNAGRLGHRWGAIVAELGRSNLVPVACHPNLKRYLDGGSVVAVTDCWVFERTPRQGAIPLPYTDIETFR